MNNECGKKLGRKHICSRERYHFGHHLDYGTRFSWAQEGPERKPDEHSVLFTLEELKAIAYGLAGPEWLEDEPELVAKIDKALKAAL